MVMRVGTLAAMRRTPFLLPRAGAAQNRFATSLYCELVLRLEKTVAYAPRGFIVEELDDDQRDVKDNRHVEVGEKLKGDSQRRPQHEEKEGVYALAVDNLRILRALVRHDSGDDKADQHSRFPPTEGVNRVFELRPFKVIDIHSFELNVRRRRDA